MLSRRLQPAVRIAARFNSTSTSKTPNILNVSLEEEDPQVDNFFDYTWGRWLKNNDAQRKARETKFSLKGLVDVLRENAGASAKAPIDVELQVKTITPYHEGKHNKVYRVDLTDGRSYALRIPYPIGHAKYRQERLKSEVATMDFLTKKHALKIPQVVAWSANDFNPLGIQYSITPFIEGDLLMKTWNPSIHDIQAKSAQIKPIVDFGEKIVSTPFHKFGSLYFTEDVSSSLQNGLPYEERDSKLADRWRIGPTTESRFWKGDSADTAAAFRGPFSTVQEYLNATASVQMAYIQEAIAKGSGSPFPKAMEIFDTYGKIAENLFPEAQSTEFASPDIFSPRLHHPDLSPLNVVMSGDTPYLMDFESTAIRPFVLHGPPRHLLHKGPKIFSKEDVPEYETLQAGEKRAIDHFMAQTQNQFAFEYLLRQLESTQSLFPAFLPGLKRRALLVDTALQANAETAQDVQYDQAMLAQEWPYIGAEHDFPVNFSEADFEQIASDTDAWNQHIMKNPFIETDGWVPAATFEELLKNNMLKKTATGDYEYQQQ